MEVVITEKSTYMFKKIVSNLPFSPSLVGQLGFYLHRLRQEELTRRAGLILTVLAVAVQGLIVLAPTETQAAASNNDIIYGGFTSKADLLRIYDQAKDSAGRADIQQIYTYFGVSRTDISNTYLGRINSKDFNSGIWSTGRYSYNKPGSDEQAKRITGTNTTIYMRKLRSFDAGNQLQTGNGYPALIGKRSVDGKWFAIVLACGNVDFTELPPAPTPSPAPKPTPAPKTVPTFVPAKAVANLTTATMNANGTTASPGDRLQYTLSVKNTGNGSGKYVVKDTISDVLEYATLIDNGGGSLQSISGAQTNTSPDTISWPSITIAPGQTAEESFIVQIKKQLPATPVNPSNPESYNCQITNSFGQTTTVMINCPLPKTIETVSASLPSTGPSENLLIGGIVLAAVSYFYARSRQLGREVRLIRCDANAGTI